MILALETEKLELNAQLSLEAQDRDKKYEQDIEAFKEQNKQHSVTICAMEERLIKLMKKNKDYQEEISVLKKTLQGNDGFCRREGDLENRCQIHGISALLNIQPNFTGCM